MAVGKVCYACKEFKIYEEYHKNKGRKDGRADSCKPCKALADKIGHAKHRESRIKKMNEKYYANKEKHLAVCKIYRDENKKKIADYKREWVARNKDRKYEQEKRWRENNVERAKESQQAWYRSNKDKVYASLLKRRSLKHFVRFEGVKRTALLDRDNWECRSCGVKVHDRSFGGNDNRHLWDDKLKAHIDHIIPISKGGDSTEENLQVLCRTCNIGKSNKTKLEIGEDGQIKMTL